MLTQTGRLAMATALLCFGVGGRAQAGFTFTTIQFPGSNFTDALGINNAGEIVGGYETPTAIRGYLLSGGTYTTTDLLTTHLFPAGINNTGQIVGEYGNSQGFLLNRSPLGFTTIDIAGFHSTTPSGINDAGQIVASAADASSRSHGFLLSGGNTTEIDVPSSFNVQAFGINNAGQIVGAFTRTLTSSNLGFLLSQGTYTTIQFPGALSTEAQGINDAGEIVGRYTDTNNIEHGFLLSGGNYTSIDIPNATFTSAFGINNTDQVVGFYGDSTGEHGFISPAVVPEPSSLVMAEIGISAVFAYGWFRRRRDQRRQRPVGPPDATE